MEKILQMTFGPVEIAGNLDDAWIISPQSRKQESQIEFIDLELSAVDGEAVPPEITLRWKLPMLNIQYRWASACGNWNCIPADWCGPLRSNLASNSPLLVLAGNDSTNRMTVACEEALRMTEFKAGVCEETNEVSCELKLFCQPEAPLKEYKTSVRFDFRRIFFSEAIEDAARWFEKFPEYHPLQVPDSARMPFYSTWYSYHQNVFADELEKECALAAQYGMKGIILDDGWQTDDNHRGYAFCGDWEISAKRFPDMRSHVEKIHKFGMKYIVWYSVPFVGEKSKNFERFKNRYLSHLPNMSCWTLDPRFPEVREFLINTYETALKEWDIDGFKLDFIDSFRFAGEDPAVRENYAGRDIRSLPHAVDKLLSDVMAHLRKIKPDILIEFRQSYIGPAIRKYGNIFRVADCPGDSISNRLGVVNLRMTNGGSAVHSDMLEWHPETTAEDAARQILAVLFAAPQISVRLEQLPESHKKMLKYHLDFMIRHRRTLQQGKFIPSGLGEYYGSIRSIGENESVIAVYRENLSVKLPDSGRCYIFNASASESILIETEKQCSGEIFNVLGESCGQTGFGPGPTRIHIPISGSICIN